MGSRKWVQSAATLLQNANLGGFFTGTLFRGATKGVCVPGLNCYSCPGALGSCPIGALQSLAISRGTTLSFYVYGFILLVGLTAGRFVCGFLCPFGFVQDLLHKIPLKKTKESAFLKKLGKLKYAILIVLVVGIPTALTLFGDTGYPAFCKWLCPAGTLQAGIPLAIANSQISGTLGWLFAWKVVLLLLIVFISIKIFRPFCRFLCPLGALYSLLNRFSVVHIRTDPALCHGCGHCRRVCPMQAESTDSPDCIRCGICVKACGTKAKAWGVNRRRQVKENGNPCM